MCSFHATDRCTVHVHVNSSLLGCSSPLPNNATHLLSLTVRPFSLGNRAHRGGIIPRGQLNHIPVWTGRHPDSWPG